MPDLLKIEQLSAGYGEAVVLSRISLSLAEGEALALLGRNGMGKTTLINTIVGVTRYFSGTIALDGRDITKLRPDQRAHAGVGWVPQERNIFKSLTVHENLTAVARPGRWTTDKVYAMFPRLNERRQNLGNQLSGGEQQMLAVGRALVLNPRVLLLDEPLEGLAPIIVEELLKALRRIIRDEGMSAILVEQNAKKILGVTDHAIIVERGAVVHAADSATLLNDRAALETHLGVTDTSPRRFGAPLGQAAFLKLFQKAGGTSRAMAALPAGRRLSLALCQRRCPGAAHAGNRNVRTEGSMLAVEGGTAPRELTVLLVEDEVLTRLMLADELRSQGLQVLEASNADEALTVLQSSLPVHLLFTDIRMPGEMDGVALAKFAHARFPGIKSIIGSSGRPEQSVGDFADAFLAKPYDLRELVEQVRRLLGESDYER